MNSIQSILMAVHAELPLTRYADYKRTVNWAKMTDETIARLAWHGLKQKANDGLGDKELTRTEREAIFEKAVTAAESNETRVGGGRTSDPVETEVKRLATKLAQKWAKKEGKKITVEYYQSDEYQGKIKEYAARPTIREQAEKNIRELDELGEMEL